MSTRRLSALAALTCAAAAGILAVVVGVASFPAGISILICLAVALGGLAFGLTRRGPARLAGIALAGLATAGTLVLIVVEHNLAENLAVALLVLISILAAREAFAVHARLPRAPSPVYPVLFFNPLSGDGRAEEVGLVEAARSRGIEAVELHRGDDLRQLVAEAIGRGADALAMAGGDGSQAIVAAMAAESGLPYACVPAGTRNHFALDLGVDRDDVIGSLDALVDGGERRVDLAEVNGRVFVNNVSLGVYADAVQRSGYREAKLRTLLDVIPDALGPSAVDSNLRWTGPDGVQHSSAAAILVSNNRYRLARPIGSGTRPRLDAGVLGIVVIGSNLEPGGAPGLGPALGEWSTAAIEVDSDGTVPAGIDGEAETLTPPLRFRSRPGALRVRVARDHPGASPSAGVPDGLLATIGSLARIAAGKDPNPEERKSDGHVRG